MFTPSFTPKGEHSLLFKRMEWRTKKPGGAKFTPGSQLRPWGQSLSPRAEVNNGSLAHHVVGFAVVVARAGSGRAAGAAEALLLLFVLVVGRVEDALQKGTNVTILKKMFAAKYG
jgi:hypothetical protein